MRELRAFRKYRRQGGPTHVAPPRNRFWQVREQGGVRAGVLQEVHILASEAEEL